MANPGISCVGNALLWFEQVVEALRMMTSEILNHLTGFIARIVVDNQDLPAERLRKSLGGNALDSFLQCLATIVSTHNDRNISLNIHELSPPVSEASRAQRVASANASIATRQHSDPRCIGGLVPKRLCR